MPARLTTEKFVAKAQKIHGNFYDYTPTQYTGSGDKVTILCPRHGPFRQIASDHLSGYGCRKCANERARERLTSNTAEFVAKARKIHGDFYDYSKTNYTRAKIAVTIICPKHGAFTKKPTVHLGGSGCRVCRYEKGAKTNTKTTDWFINKAIERHGDTYIYSSVNYKKADQKVIIICKTHGPFLQTPASHLRQGCGCPQCADIVRKEKRTKPTEQFIRDARQVHGYRYDYSETDYRGAGRFVTIICPDHGPFRQLPTNHLKYGCRKCGGTAPLTTADFIERAQEIHGDRYVYSKVRYSHGRKKVVIVCPQHGEFSQVPESHLAGNGCGGCAETGFDQTKPGFLYYVRIETGAAPLYKIGITNLSVEKRLSKDRDKITVLGVWEYPFGIEALERETAVLRLYKDQIYEGEPVLQSAGTAEIFELDVLGLDQNR